MTIVLTTFISAFISLAVATCYLAISYDDDQGTLVYFIFLGFINIIIPTAITILVLAVISNLIQSSNMRKKLLLEIVLLTLFIQAGLWLWAVAEVAIFNGFSMQEIMDDYNSQFKGWLAVAIPLGLVAPPCMKH